jgi:putative Holliday junction resolvase
VGRILSIDYGRKRIGLAVTDPMQMIANGLDTVSPQDIFLFLEKYLANNAVEKFVIGLPKQMNGAESETMGDIRAFATALGRKFPDVPIEFFDERFTSVLAHQAMIESGISKKARQNKALVDKISATIILQGFLEQLRIKLQGTSYELRENA